MTPWSSAIEPPDLRASRVPAAPRGLEIPRNQFLVPISNPYSKMGLPYAGGQSSPSRRRRCRPGPIPRAGMRQDRAGEPAGPPQPPPGGLPPPGNKKLLSRAISWESAQKKWASRLGGAEIGGNAPSDDRSPDLRFPGDATWHRCESPGQRSANVNPCCLLPGSGLPAKPVLDFPCTGEAGFRRLVLFPRTNLLYSLYEASYEASYNLKSR